MQLSKILLPEILLPKIRAAAYGKVETSRGRKSPAQEYMGDLRECRRKQQYSGEARAPETIIQEAKKDFRSLNIVFMEIQPVTGFYGDILTRRNRRISD